MRISNICKSLVVCCAFCLLCTVHASNDPDNHKTCKQSNTFAYEKQHPFNAYDSLEALLKKTENYQYISAYQDFIDELYSKCKM